MFAKFSLALCKYHNIILDNLMRNRFSVGQKIKKKICGVFIIFTSFLTVNVLVCLHFIRLVARIEGQLGQEHKVETGNQNKMQR